MRVLTVLISLAVVACVAPVRQTTLKAVGLDPTALDRSVDPCNDFYRFACGGWIDRTTIPSDKPLWMRSFLEIEERNQGDLRRILDASVGGAGDDAARLGGFYGACMDEAAVEAAGTTALSRLFGVIDAVNDKASLAAALIALHEVRVWAVFDVGPMQDMKDATRVIAALDQNGLGLPDRDYYLKDDASTKKVLAAYKNMATSLLSASGVADAAKAVSESVAIETELAKASKSKVERRDPHGIYNKIDRAGLVKHAPSLPWDAYFAALGMAGVTDVSVTSVPFFEAVSRLLDTVEPAAWRSYLRLRLLAATAPTLSKAFDEEHFKLQQALTGQESQEPRWKRCVDATDAALGELLGKVWVAERFGGSAKADAEAMAVAVTRVFGQNLDALDWMDAPTRARAHKKLASVAFNIGYPKRWRTYAFPVEPKSYAANALASRAERLQRELAKIGKPVDKDEWQMSPPTVNAYYEPQLNQMVFPAGIMQPPFYDPRSNLPVNLGGMGMVVGHELTHGFDDQGSQFDGDGNLKSWWEPAVSERFKARTQCVAKQYAEYEPLPGVKLNGELTLGENIADLGGLKLAFRAYRAMRAAGGEISVADGFTEDQQFFLAAGQAWCTKSRDEFARLMVKVNPHSPSQFRINGPLSDLPEFSSAFQCKEGAPMRPANACEVW